MQKLFMYHKLARLVPIITLFTMMLIIAFLILLSPAILEAYEPLDVRFILISLLVGVSVISAIVGVVAHKVLEMEHPPKPAIKKR